MSEALDLTAHAERPRRRAIFEACASLQDLLEQIVSRNLKLSGRTVKLRAAVEFVLHLSKKIFEDSNFTNPTDILALSTLRRTLDQCVALNKVLYSFHLKLVDWNASARKLKKPARFLVGTIHNFVMFAAHINRLYKYAQLTAQFVEDAITQAVIEGSKEAECVSKSLVSALVTNKAIWMSSRPGQHRIVISPVEDIPKEVLDFLEVWYKQFNKLIYDHEDRVVYGRGFVPFNKVVDWYMKSTQIVKPKNHAPASKAVKDIVHRYFPSPAVHASFY